MATKLRHIVALVLCILIAGCTKKASPPALEAFSFSGVVKTCVTAIPVSNLRLTVKGYVPGTGGILGTPGTSYDLGSVVTDQSGYFNITPIKHNGVTRYTIVMDTVNQEISYSVFIVADSISKSGKNNFDMSMWLSEFGYVRLRYSDTIDAGTSDKLTVDASTDGTGCGFGLAPLWMSAVPLPSPDNLAVFAGIIQNGTILYRMVGNANCTIAYQKTNGRFPDSLHIATVFCKPNDTVYYNFNY